jgi:branched-subunit amino acid transport protein
MSFSVSINCVNYNEPLFWCSLLFGATIGWLAAALLVRLSSRTNLPNLFAGFLAICGALPIAILSSLIALAVLYGVIRGGSVCIHFVRPALFLAAGITVLSVWRSISQHRSAETI